MTIFLPLTYLVEVDVERKFPPPRGPLKEVLEKFDILWKIKTKMNRRYTVGEDDESLVTWTCHTKLANTSGYIIQMRYLKLNISHYASHMRHISSLQFAMVHH